MGIEQRVNTIVHLRIINDIAEFESLREQWNQLLSTRETRPLPLVHEWVFCWWRNFAQDRQLYITCVYEGERLLALAPFMRDVTTYRGVPATELRLMANGHSPYGDVIIDGSASPELVCRIVDELISGNSGDIMVFAKLPDTSAAYPYLVSNSRIRGRRVGFRGSLVTPILQLNQSWDAYFKSRSRKFRKSISNKLNRFSREGDFTIHREIVTTRRSPVVDEIVAISKQSWKSKVKNDLGSNAAGRAFLLDLVDVFGATQAVQVWLLRKRGVPVAYEFHVIFDGVVYPLRADFVEEYRKYSPGSILEYTAIKTLFTEGGASQYDSCADNYWYLNNWTDEMRKQYDVEVFANGIKPTVLHLLEYRAIPLLRRIRDRVGNSA